MNCSSVSLYRYVNNDSCISRPNGTYIVDAEYGIIDVCYEKCESCEKGGDDKNNNCLSFCSNFMLPLR